MKNELKKIITALLFIIILFILSMVFVSCSENNSEKDVSKDQITSAENDDSNIAEETTDDIYADDLQEQDFGGAPFKIAMQDAFWLTLLYDAEEEIGEPMNDEVYRRNRRIEERFNIEISQELIEYGTLNATFRKNVGAGIEAHEIYLLVDRDALTFGAEGMVYKIAEIPNIDISKPYWSQSMNKSLTIGGELMFAYGAFNLTVYDYTHVMLFNKQMISDLQLESPYELVKSGNWTFDKFSEMATAATRDLDGDGIMDENDIYGFVSLAKYILPSFWVAAGVESISKSSDDIPQFTLIGDEKFASIIDKAFAMTYDNGSWFRGDAKNDANISEIGDKLVINNQTLFSNCTFKKIGDLRSMETDFGIIQYPKYTATQDKYYTFVEGGNPGIVPITASNLQMTGTILESLNAESAKTVIPAYYDISLKTKQARDEESVEMLDLIFENRIYDLGNTLWCNFFRDGMFLTMFEKNDRNLASQLEKVEPVINAEIDKVVKALGLQE